MEDDLLPPPEMDVEAAGAVRPPSPLEKAATLAQAEGDISHLFTSTELAKIGADAVADYERDETDREDWRKKVEAALKAAAQEESGEKSYPWPNAANVKYPMLTVASLQFNARSYPAIVKGDEAVSVKVVGKDNGLPKMGPDGLPMMQTPMGPVAKGPMGPMVLAGNQFVPLDPAMPQTPVWQRPPGAKTKRAQRVRDYMNTVLFYRVEGWEEDTDALLLQLPIVGCAFRKVCVKSDGKLHVSLVPALNLVAPMKAKDVATAPRLTEVIEDVFPYQIADRMASGHYRTVELTPESDDDQAPRTLLEQHRLMDMDGDGVPEPYIVTVDKATSEVLRLESNFSMAEVMKPGTRVEKLLTYYIKYDFFPHPQGCFYGIGFGHLLEPLTEVVNTTINQLIDAGTAQIAGGGFIAGGVRLQGNSSRIRLAPGEFKMINGVTGSQLREAIYERTVPQPSAVAFQLLDMMLAAARDISSVKDVITGEGSNMGQVGTTLALIEQGLQVFTAIYKRVYRSLKAEFQMVFDTLARYGGPQVAEDYMNILDDPEANFQTDFNGADFDIRPVSDPTSVTKMQKMARAQFLGGFIGRGLNDQEIYKRMFEAADVEDIDALFPQGPPQPDPKTMADTQDKMASAGLKQAQTHKTVVETQLLPIEAGVKATKAGAEIAAGAASGQGGIPGMGGVPGNPMGFPGGREGVRTPERGVG